MNKKIIIGIIVGIMVLIGIMSYQFLKPNSQPQFVEGEESLEVTILDPNDEPFLNLEVDLWTLENQNGPPTAGYLITDSDGKVIFKIPKGEYLIGFNGNNFPKEFINPGKIQVNVKKGENTETIRLEPNI
jgi:hypothetical protein